MLGFTDSFSLIQSSNHLRLRSLVKPVSQLRRPLLTWMFAFVSFVALLDQYIVIRRTLVFNELILSTVII